MEQLQERLNEAIGRVMGAVAAGVVGIDGIPVAEFKKEEAELDLSIAEAELASIVAEARRLALDAKGGDFEEVFVRAKELTLVARMVNADYFVFILLGGELQNLGLARFELKKLSQDVNSLLS